MDSVFEGGTQAHEIGHHFTRKTVLDGNQARAERLADSFACATLARLVADLVA